MASKADSDRTERVVTSTCSYDCGARCLLKVHVPEGRRDRRASLSPGDHGRRVARAKPRKVSATRRKHEYRQSLDKDGKDIS